MTVDGPGIRFFSASRQISLVLRYRRPQPKGAIDMDPRTGSIGFGANCFKVIKGPRVDITGLQDEQGMGVQFRYFRDLDLPLGIRRNQLDTTFPESQGVAG